VNVAGAQLKPHLSVLLPALLEAKGEMERSFSNQLSRTGADANDIDTAMVSFAKTNFTMDPITKVFLMPVISLLSALQIIF